MNSPARSPFEAYIIALTDSPDFDPEYFGALLGARERALKRGRRSALLMFAVAAAAYVRAVGQQISLPGLGAIDLPPELLMLLIGILGAHVSRIDVLVRYLEVGIAILAERKHSLGPASVIGYIGLDDDLFSLSLITRARLERSVKWQKRDYGLFSKITFYSVSVVQTGLMIGLFIQAFSMGGYRAAATIIFTFIGVGFMIESVSFRLLHFGRLSHLSALTAAPPSAS